MQISRPVRVLVVSLLVFSLAGVGAVALMEARVVGDRPPDGPGDLRDQPRPPADAGRGGDVLIMDVGGFVLSAEASGPITRDLDYPGGDISQPADDLARRVFQEAGFVGGFVHTWIRADREADFGLASAEVYEFDRPAPEESVHGVPEEAEEFEVPGATGFLREPGEEVFAEAWFSAGSRQFSFQVLVPSREEAIEVIRMMVEMQHERLVPA